MCTPTQGVWQPAGCVSCELVCVCVSLVRVVIICPASTHTALVSSPSLAVLHLTTYLPTYRVRDWHCKGDGLEAVALTDAVLLTEGVVGMVVRRMVESASTVVRILATPRALWCQT